tara:strand:+ start:40 stop:780 length:741 start_codon:yes stop_codon:yes gene_type:complete
MAFKMKGPSLHQGTKRHQAAVQAASPAKGIEGDPDIEIIEEDDAEWWEKSPGVDRTDLSKAESKLIKSSRKKANKATRKNNFKKKTAAIDAKEIAASKKVKGAIKKGAKKVVNYAKDKTMMTKKDIAQRKEEKPLSAKEQIRGETDVAKRLEMRKKRRSGIADNLEYIFMDGKRPDDKKVAEHQKAVETKKSEMLIKKYDMQQNEHTNYEQKYKPGAEEEVAFTSDNYPDMTYEEALEARKKNKKS